MRQQIVTVTTTTHVLVQQEKQSEFSVFGFFFWLAVVLVSTRLILVSMQ